jgi:hypothetical protein
MAQYFFLGSCFSVEISQRLKQYAENNSLEIQVLANPFGTLFAPSAIANTLSILANKQEPILTKVNQQFHCLTFASKFQSEQEHELSEIIYSIKSTSAQFLKQSQKAIITLGTAWVYEFLSENLLVGNCHRIPNHQFKKQLLSTTEVIESLKLCIASLKSIHPEIKIDFTISPVRHLRDGLIENSISKSILRVAVHEIISQLPDVGYFPAFEIFNEELRDKSYFREDLAHPNDKAIDIIFSKWLKHEQIESEQNSIPKSIH